MANYRAKPTVSMKGRLVRANVSITYKHSMANESYPCTVQAVFRGRPVILLCLLAFELRPKFCRAATKLSQPNSNSPAFGKPRSRCYRPQAISIFSPSHLALHCAHLRIASIDPPHLRPLFHLRQPWRPLRVTQQLQRPSLQPRTHRHGNDYRPGIRTTGWPRGR